MQAAVRDDSGKLALRLRGRSEQSPVSRLFAHLFRQMWPPPLPAEVRRRLL